MLFTKQMTSQNLDGNWNNYNSSEFLKFLFNCLRDCSIFDIASSVFLIANFQLSCFSEEESNKT